MSSSDSILTSPEAGSDCCPPDAPPIVAPTSGPEAEIELATLAKALGHPARVRILKLLLAQEQCIVGEIAGELPLAASTVSQHLKLLHLPNSIVTFVQNLDEESAVRVFGYRSLLRLVGYEQTAQAGLFAQMCQRLVSKTV